MLAFELSVNGKRLCTAGIDETGVLAANITWVLGAVGEPDEHVSVTLGGLRSRVSEHLRWLNHPLKRNDLVTVRIVETDKVDRPRSRKKESQKLRLQQQQQYVRQMARELGWLIQIPKRKRVNLSRDRMRKSK